MKWAEKEKIIYTVESLPGEKKGTDWSYNVVLASE